MDRYEFMRQRQAESKPDKSVVMPINEVPMLEPLQNSAQRPAPNVVQPWMTRTRRPPS